MERQASFKDITTSISFSKVNHVQSTPLSGYNYVTSTETKFSVTFGYMTCELSGKCSLLKWLSLKKGPVFWGGLNKKKRRNCKQNADKMRWLNPVISL